MKHTSNSTEETKQIATDFASKLNGGEVIFLKGNLGSGKTTFVQGVAEALGYTDPVRSPTFTIMNHYLLEGQKIKEIVHIDLYRMEEENEVSALGLEDFLGDPSIITFVEWPKDQVEAFIKNGYYEINFRFVDENTREIIVNE